MKIKQTFLGILVSFLPFCLWAVEANTNSFFLISEIVYLKLSTQLQRERLALLDTKQSLSKQEFDEKMLDVKCNQFYLLMEYQTFISKSGFKLKEEHMQTLNKKIREVEKELEQNAQMCRGVKIRDFDQIIDLNSLLK